MDDGYATLRGRERDAAEALALPGSVGGDELEVPKHRPDHDIHLELCERRANAAAQTASEWNPRVGIGLLPHVAVGIEVCSVDVETLVLVCGGDLGDHPDGSRGAAAA